MTSSKSVILRGLFLLVLVTWTRFALTREKNDFPTFNAAEIEFFEKKIRPILSKRCYGCHSGKAKEVQGGLRLDSRAAVLRGGETGAAIVPGKPSESLLIRAINDDGTYSMPPKSKLPAEEIVALTNWVELQAPWPVDTVKDGIASEGFDLQARKQVHWCWQDVQKYQPPLVGQADWPRQGIDHFVLSKLEANELSPAPTAKRRTLIRRVFFDMTGLPPSPDQVQSFVDDDSPAAYEKVVDHLLQSPHFGERWARHWMDLFRYAEAYGHEFDYPISHAFRYRDYLIRALNADLPYDQFITEHIAGDLLENPRRHLTEGYNESMIGTGFWWLGEATHAPVDVRDDEARRIENQIDVMTKTFLGLTVACARCHDHKFDAISTKDYYALAGFLQSSRRQYALLDPGGKIRSRVAQLRSVEREGDAIVLATVRAANDLSGELFGRYLLASNEVAAGMPIDVIVEQWDVKAESLSRWVEAIKQNVVQTSSHPMRGWTALARLGEDVTAADIDGLRKRMDEEKKRSKEFDAMNPLVADFEDGYNGWFKTGEAFGMTSTQTRQWESRSNELQLTLPGRADSGVLSSRLQGVLRSPTFTLTHPNIFYRIRGKDAQLRLMIDGYFMNQFSGLLFEEFQLDVNTEEDYVWLRQQGDLGRYLGHQVYIEVVDHSDGFVAVDEIRQSGGDVPPTPPSELAMEVLEMDNLDSLESLAMAYGQVWSRVTQAWKSGNLDSSDQTLIHWAVQQRLFNVPNDVQSKLTDLRRQKQELEKDISSPIEVLAMTDGTGENEQVFIRGNHRTLGEEAPRQLLTALVGRKPLVKQGSGRLALADDIVDPANSLTARVLVNRIWYHLFGRGIVNSVDNFGVLGERPSHPELLDFLASEFVNQGWSVKRLIRTILLSSAYQMSSVPNSAASELDPENLLLHCMRIRRLEGEAIRDSILAISGRIDRQLFGSSVPVHVTAFMQGRGRPESGDLDGQGRRSIYTEVRRNFLSPMMLAFDMPIPFNAIGRRNVSNVPAQALILMNDPLVVQQSHVWAKNLLSDKGLSIDERIEKMYLVAFACSPQNSEFSQAKEFLQRQGKELGLEPEQYERDQRVWADLCHVMMNVKKFIFIH